MLNKITEMIYNEVLEYEREHDVYGTHTGCEGPETIRAENGQTSSC